MFNNLTTNTIMEILTTGNVELSLDEYNKMVMEISNDENKKKSFTGFIDEIWEECIKNSDKCVVTGKKPEKKK